MYLGTYFMLFLCMSFCFFVGFVLFFSSAYASNPLNTSTQERISIVSEKHLFPSAIVSFSFSSVSIIPSSSSELLMPFCLNAMVTTLHPLILKISFPNAYFCQVLSAVQGRSDKQWNKIRPDLCPFCRRKRWYLQPFEWWRKSTGRDPAVQTAPVPSHFCSLSPWAVPSIPDLFQEPGREVSGLRGCTAAITGPPRPLRCLGQRPPGGWGSGWLQGWDVFSKV